MPYQNEIIFAAGYGIICILVIFLYIVLAWMIICAADTLNQKMRAFGLLAKNAHALKVLSRINNRKRFLKTGVSRPVFIKPKVEDQLMDCCACCSSECSSVFSRGNEVFCSETCADDFNS